MEKSDAEPLSSSDDRKYEEPEAVYTPEVGVVSLQENDNNVETELVEPHDTGNKSEKDWGNFECLYNGT